MFLKLEFDLSSSLLHIIFVTYVAFNLMDCILLYLHCVLCDFGCLNIGLED